MTNLARNIPRYITYVGMGQNLVKINTSRQNVTSLCVVFGDRGAMCAAWASYHGGARNQPSISAATRKLEHHYSQVFEKIALPDINLTMFDKGPRAKFTVSVEGNIGSGKSTLLQHFSKYNDVQVLAEPVDKWRNVRGYNLLDLMYKDPCRWAHTFQTYVQMTMLELHVKPSPAPVKLIERSVFSARYCFVENLFREGKMSKAEYSVYCEWFKMITDNLNVGLDLIVYLQTDPSALHDRIKKRARSEEQTIPLQYLEDLHNLHEEWLVEKKHMLPAPVLVLDANESLPVMYQKFEEHTADILCQKLAKNKVKALDNIENRLPQSAAGIN